jgi:hypothetical protein
MSIRDRKFLTHGLTHAGYFAHLTSIVGPQPDDPVAALTSLGWMIYGKCNKSLNYQRIRNSQIVGFTCVENDSKDVSNDALLQYIRFYNNVESIGISHENATMLSVEDERANQLMHDSMFF